VPLDPAIASLLALMAEAGGPPIEEQTVAEARERAAALVPLAGDGAEVAARDERDIAGVPCIVYRPVGGDAPRPVLAWFHGGGWVISDAAEHDAVCRDLAAGAGCVVVSVDYRLAPEHQAPAAVDDALAVSAWLVEHAGAIGGDPARVAVGGDSAGGNLAAVVAQRLGNRLRGQVLLYPTVDLTVDWPSLTENGEGYLLTKARMDWFAEHYVAGSGVERDDPRISPMRASDDVIAGTAPAYVLTAEYDPLRDEGEAYGARLAALGVDTTVRRFDGMIHWFHRMRLVTPVAGEAIDACAAFLRRVLA
jgi:acetyl esterase